jgi:Glycosyl hydrolase catalytic core
MAAVGAAIVLACVVAGPAEARRAAPEFFGVSAVNANDRDFERMGSGEVGTYRVLLSWPVIQATRDGEYDWTVPDFEIASAVRNGMEPFPFFYGSPDFAATATESPPLGSSVARTEWQRFLAAAVARYGPEGEFWTENPDLPYTPVEAWQVSNEPNSQFFWRPKPSARKYAKLLRLSGPAIKGVDPEAEVILGGMFGFPNGRRSIDAREFLKDLYRVRNVRAHFDGVAVHPYGGTLRLMTYQIARARKIMDRNGDDDASIWITELGWATDGPPKWPLVTSRKGQAKLLRKSFKRILERRGRFGIERVIWFVWRDYQRSDCKWCGSAGLLDRGGNPKPAWSAFRRFTARTR